MRTEIRNSLHRYIGRILPILDSRFSILGSALLLSCAIAHAQITVSPAGGGGGSGTVTSVAVTTANGVSGSVANPTTTPAITLTLGAITPTSITIGGVTSTGATGTGNLVFGTNPTILGLSLGSNRITSVTDPSGAQDAATKNYVDNALAAFQPLESVYAASTANIAGTYLNGAAGIGATFTVTATGALSMDSVSPTLNSRVLLKDQSTGFQNGVYTVTVVGTTGVSPVLTRSLDYNTPAEINAGDLIPVVNGTVNAVTSWLETAVITTIGTDALVFTKYSANPSSYLSITGGTLTGNLLFTDNTYDIGASGATRPRNLFLAGNATIGGAATGTSLFLNGATAFSSGQFGTRVGTDQNFEIWSAGGTTVSIGSLNNANNTFGNLTIEHMVIADGLIASGVSANDFSASTGTFLTSTGANQLSGATTITDATTPSLTTASGKTNTGKVTINGKTSGSIVLTTADATAQALTVSGAAQTVGAATVTVPNLAGVSDTLAMTTLAQTLGSKTLTSPVISSGLTASGSGANTFAGSTGTFLTSTGAVTIGPGAVGITGVATFLTGTTSNAPINIPAGTLKTSPAAGDFEQDGVQFYYTPETAAARTAVANDQYFHLTAAGGTITTIANFFGATSNPTLVSGGYYEIEATMWFLSSSTGTVTWTLTNSAAPTSQNIYFEMSPVTGIVAPPGTATMLVGQIYNDATAAKALTATGALTAAANYYTKIKIWLHNGTGTSLKIQATVSSGNITPGIGSTWHCRRISPNNIGTFVN